MIRINSSTGSTAQGHTAAPVAQLDKSFLQLLRSDIEGALQEIGRKRGVVIKAESCRFTPLSATMNLQIATISRTGEVVDLERSTLLRLLPYLHLGADALTTTFSLGGRTFKLAGYKKARYRKPFSLTCQSTGMTYVATESQVRTALKFPVQIPPRSYVKEFQQ